MAQQDIQTQDGVSTLYNIATDKHLLKSGMTEDEFRKQIGSEKGQKSFYNYAKSHGLKMRPYDDFVQRYFGTPSVVGNPEPGNKPTISATTNLTTDEALGNTSLLQKAQEQKPNVAQLGGTNVPTAVPFAPTLTDEKIHQDQFKDQMNEAMGAQVFTQPTTDYEAAMHQAYKSDMKQSDIAIEHLRNWGQYTDEGKSALKKAEDEYAANEKVYIDAFQKDKEYADIVGKYQALQQQDPEYQAIVKRYQALQNSREFANIKSKYENLQKNDPDIAVARSKYQIMVNSKQLTPEQADEQFNAEANKIFTDKYGKQYSEELNQAFSSKYGKMYSDEVNALFNSKYGEQMNQELATAFSNKYGADLERERESAFKGYEDEAMKNWSMGRISDETLGQKAAKNQNEELYAQLDDKINARIEQVRNDELQKEKDGGIGYKIAKAMYVAENGYTYDDVRLKEHTSTLQAAKKYVKDANEMIEAVEQGKGFGSAVGQTLSKVDTWDFGMTQLLGSVALKQAADKADKGQTLTEDEELLLEAAANYMATSMYYSDKLGRWYKAGQTTAASIPFMLQFMATGGAESAMTNALTRGIYKFALKQAAKRGSKWAVKKGVKKAVVKGATKFAGTALADIGYSAGMTAAFSPLKITEGTISRMAGTIQPQLKETEDGFDYAGRVEGSQQGLGEALWNSSVSEFTENFSEVFFNPFKVLKPGKALIASSKRLGELARKVEGNTLVQTIRHISSNPYLTEIRRMSKFGGLFEETMEEEVGGLMKWAFTTDTNKEQAGFTLDGQIDTVLGLAPSVLAMGYGSTAIYYGAYATDLANLKKTMSNQQKQAFSKIMSEARSGEFGRKAHDYLRDVIMDNTLSENDKKAIIYSVVNKYKDSLNNDIVQEAANAKQETREQQITEHYEQIANTANGNIERVLIMGETSPLVKSYIKKGKIVYDENGNIDREKSDNSCIVVTLTDDGEGNIAQQIRQIPTKNLNEVVNHGTVAENAAFDIRQSHIKFQAQQMFPEGGLVTIPNSDGATSQVHYDAQGNILIDTDGGQIMFTPEQAIEQLVPVQTNEEETNEVENAEPTAAENNETPAEPVGEPLEPEPTPERVTLVGNGTSVTAEKEGDSYYLINENGQRGGRALTLQELQDAGYELKQEPTEPTAPEMIDEQLTPEQTTAAQGLFTQHLNETTAPTGTAATQESAEQPKQQFADNKVVTASAVEAARRRIQARRSRLNMGIDPEEFADYMIIGAAYVESGVRDFAQFSKKMIEDLGGDIRPYLKSIYEAVRTTPELSSISQGMTSTDVVANTNVSQINIENNTNTQEPEQRNAEENVPDWVEDSPQAARERGYRMVNGYRVDRQEPITDKADGKDCSIAFGTETKDQVAARYAVVDAMAMQPSHKDGRRNPLFFIDEAQPKERTDQVSVGKAREIAQQIRPEEITMGATAYTGTPIINARGEVIQGNNRTAALQEMYANHPQSVERYKKYLQEHASEFGLTAESIDQMEQPVLVRIADVADNEAIHLGNMTAQDLESGKAQRIDATETLQKIGDGAGWLIETLLRSEDEEATLKSVIRENAAKALEYLRDKGVISDVQYQSAFKNGAVTPEAIDDLANIVTETLFSGSKYGNIRTMFNALPDAAKKALVEVMYRDLKSPQDAHIKGYVQEAIVAYYAAIQQPEFAAIGRNSTAEQAEQAMATAKVQTNMDGTPTISERFSNFAIKLATLYAYKSKNALKSLFNHFFDDVQGANADLFGENAQKTLEQAVKDNFNVDINNNGRQSNDGTLVQGTGSSSTTGGQGGNGQSESRPKGENGTRGEDNTPSSSPIQRPTEHPAGGTGAAGNSLTIAQAAAQAAAKAKLQEAQQKTARTLSEKLGVRVNIITNENDIQNKKVRAGIQEAAQRGERVRGWYDAKTNEVCIYLPGCLSVADVEQTFIHEVVAHKGLRALLGAEAFDKLCDVVWNWMSANLPQAEKDKWLSYPGVNGNTRAAADEYMAFIAEQMRAGELEQEANSKEMTTEQSAMQKVWQTMLDYVKQALHKLGIGQQSGTFHSEQEFDDYVRSLIVDSYTNLRNNAQHPNEQTPRNEAEYTSSQIDSLRKTYDGIKNEYDNTDNPVVVLFKDGDEYLLAFDDASVGEQVLGIQKNSTTTDKGSTFESVRFPLSKIDSYLPKLVRGGYRVAVSDVTDTKGKANNTRFSISNAEPYDYDAYPYGRVEPNLAEKEVEVVSTTANHGFANYGDARNWAKQNISKTYSDKQTGGKGDIRISNAAIDKFLSQSSVDKSDNKDVHLSVLKVLPELLRTSIDVETHPDFLKGIDGKRTAANEINKDVLIHRCYGAASIDGVPYRVKITLKEDARDSRLPHSTHSYEATKIELLAGTLVKPNGDNPNTNNSISAAKLLQNVGMSYNPSVKILDESKIRTDEFNKQAQQLPSENDAEYLAAVERGDMQKAAEMVQEAARAAGYTGNTDYQGVGAWGAPTADVDKEDFANLDALQEAVERETPTNVYGIINGISGQPEDIVFYPERLRKTEPAALETAAVLRQLRNKHAGADTKVTVYRAVPNNIKGNQLMAGDWVALSKQYCIDHAESRYGENNYRIIENEVPIKNIWWDGNDTREFGFDDGNYDQAEKNTANNRKLLAPVTYDDNGNIIPLSQRFNDNSNDIRFSVSSYSPATDRTLTDEARQEMTAIAEQAKANGTYMQAPNGKPTRLTERQWLQVRTQAFKKWFGDWEKAARIDKLRKSEPVHITGEEYKGKYELNRNSAKQWLRDNLRGGYTIADTGEKVFVGRKGIDKVTSHSMGNEAYLKSLVAIPQMLDNAIFISEEKAEKSNALYDKYRYYVVGLKIDGEDYTAKLTVGIDENGKKYYDQALTEIEKGNLIEIANGFISTEAEPNPSVTGGKDTKLISILQTNPSKIVDENGEPLVVYHGTPSEFTVFNGAYSSGMFMFTDVAPLAETFANKHTRNGGKIVHSFLNARNLKTFEMEGYDWVGNGVGDNEGKSINKGRKHNFTYVESLKAKREQYDGVALHNVYDTGIVSDHYIVFNPTQIKSATDNNGSFSESSDDIRFSIIGEQGAANLDRAEEATTRLDNLQVARDMEQAGKDAKAIRLATGWERGADGKWRYEIPDAKIIDTIDIDGTGRYIVKRYESDMLWNNGRLGDKVVAPELFAAYPQLKNYRIDTDKLTGDWTSNGSFDPKRHTITIHADELKYLNSVLAHEIQHAIQDIEGFAKGGNTDTVRQLLEQIVSDKEGAAEYGDKAERQFYHFTALAGMLKNIYPKFINSGVEKQEQRAVDIYWEAMDALGNDPNSEFLYDFPDDKTPDEVAKSGMKVSEAIDELSRLADKYKPSEGNMDAKKLVDKLSTVLDEYTDAQLYHALAGEVESRNVQSRLSLTPEQRRSTLLRETEDVAREDQLFLDESLASAEAQYDALDYDTDNTLISSGSYFSGGGLLEEGLKGIIKPSVAVEYNKRIAGVYADNNGNHIVTADVRDVNPDELLSHIDGTVQYFHASPVCKNFSTAKANAEEVELDKETAEATAKFILQAKPKIVTIENVKGYKNSNSLAIITKALEEAGYKYDIDIYNAADFGGYTKRERLILRAVRDGELPEKPKPLPKSYRPKGWIEAVEDLIDTLPEKKGGVPAWMDERLKAMGIDYRDIDKPLYVFGQGNSRTDISHAFADELLPTLRTHGGDVIIMPDGRVLKATPRVLARVSGISDSYKMPQTDDIAHTVIGNGIPTQLTQGVIAPLLETVFPNGQIITQARQLATDTILDALSNAGIEVERISQEEAQRVLAEQNSGAEFAKSRKSSIFVPTSKVPKEELAVAHHALFAKVQDQAEVGTLYYVDSANYTHIFVGGRHIGAIKIDGDEELIKFLEKGIDNGTYRNTADINRWNESIGSRERYDNHSNASTPRQRGGNERTDILYQGLQTDTKRDWSQSIGDSGSTAQPLRTKDGVVFGYTKDGKIYLTEQGLNPNTPIHEYTHLWAKALQQKNPAAWRSIVNLLKGTPMWDEVVNDPNYKDLTTDDEIASEVLSRYSGKNGAERFQREAKRILRDKSISAYARTRVLLDNVREALSKFWNWVGKELFHIDHFDSVEEVADRILYDLTNGTDISTDIQEESNDTRFSIAPLTPRDGESIAEFAQRNVDYQDSFKIEEQALEYERSLRKSGFVEFMEKADRKIFDAARPIMDFQNDFVKRGATLTTDNNAYMDVFRAGSRSSTAIERYQFRCERPLALAVQKIMDSKKLNNLGFVWQNLSKDDLNDRKDRKNGTAITPFDLLGIYLQAKDCKEAVKLGLPDRGEEGFEKNIALPNEVGYEEGVSYDKIIDTVESVLGQDVIDDLWAKVRACTEYALDYQEKRGYIDHDTREKYRRDFYVPERGWVERDMSGIEQDYQQGLGKMYNSPYNAALQQAKGRTSLASNPFAYISSIVMSSIITADSNITNAHLLQFCLDNQELGLQTDAFRIKKFWTIRELKEDGSVSSDISVSFAQPTERMYEHDKEIREKIGAINKQIANVQREISNWSAIAKDKTMAQPIRNAAKARIAELAKTVADLNARQKMLYGQLCVLNYKDKQALEPQLTKGEQMQHIIYAVKDGQQYVMLFKDVRVANAINKAYRSTGDQLFGANNIFRRATRGISAMLTQYNPEFAARNFVKDKQTAFATLLAEHPQLVPEFEKTLNSPLFRHAVLTYIFGQKIQEKEKFSKSDMGDIQEYNKLLEEYFERGAQTGYSFLPDLKTLRSNWEDLIKENKGKQLGRAMLGALSVATEWSETAIRFAAYYSARKNGMEADEAASLSKELTTNFDRGGEWSHSKFFALYSFMRATLNGNLRYWRMLQNGKRGVIGFTGIAAFYFALGFISNLIAPDDPDDYIYASDYSRQNNLIIGKVALGKLLGITGKIPLGHFMVSYYAAGTNAARAIRGDKSWGRATWDTFASFTKERMPDWMDIASMVEADENGIRLDGTGYAQGAAPTLIRPFTDILLNEDYKGATINNEYDWNKDTKDILKYKKGTSQFFIDVQNGIYEAVGGDLSVKNRQDDNFAQALADVSPSTLQHIVEGYTGGIGESLLTTSAMVYSAVQGNSVGVNDIPFLRKFFSEYDAERIASQQIYLLEQDLNNYEKLVDSYKIGNRDKYSEATHSDKYKIFKRSSKDVKRLRKRLEAGRIDIDDMKTLIELNKEWNRNK